MTIIRAKAPGNLPIKINNKFPMALRLDRAMALTEVVLPLPSALFLPDDLRPNYPKTDSGVDR
jgi:hypothetical protein